MTTQNVGGSVNPTRRTLVKGAAWSVPVVAMGSTVAAAQVACSPNSCPEVSFGGVACKHPGNSQPGNPNSKVYHFIFCFNNTTIDTITITLTGSTVNGVNGQAEFSSGDNTLTLAAGQAVCVDVDMLPFADSANGMATLSFSWVGANYPAQVTGTSSVSTTINDLPPCGNIDEPANYPHAQECHVYAGGTAGAVTQCPTGL